MALAEAGRINPHLEQFAHDEAEEVSKKLAAHEISGRVVLIPSDKFSDFS